ncbi:MAG: hypothetical protein EBE86_002050 [Hormoscilla sp. GUM202]|nr:hypothetical protein [Hormoscilla sp. GUM202]
MGAMLAERWLSANGLAQEFHQGESSKALTTNTESSKALTTNTESSKALTTNSESAKALTTNTESAKALTTNSVRSEDFSPQKSDTFDIAATRHEGGYALRKLFHESDRLIMVKYSTPICRPCHTLKPILSKVVDEFDNKIHYVEIDIEQDPEIAENAGVTGTPTVQFFKDKELIHQYQGVKQKSQYRETIQSNL